MPAASAPSSKSWHRARPTSAGSSWPSRPMRTGLPSFIGLYRWFVAEKGRSKRRFQSTRNVPPTAAESSHRAVFCTPAADMGKVRTCN